MERALMFTAYELIICVTPRAPGSELALSRKNRRPLQPRSTVFRQVLQYEIQH